MTEQNDIQKALNPELHSKPKKKSKTRAEQKNFRQRATFLQKDYMQIKLRKTA